MGVTVDGKALAGTLADVKAGQHEIAVLSGEEALWTGLVEVPHGYEVRCRWQSAAFDCYDAVAVASPTFAAETTQTTSTTRSSMPASVGVGGPSFGVVVQGAVPTRTTTESTTTVTTRGPGSASIVPSERPPAALDDRGRVELVVVALDSLWVDVWVDGKRQLELRSVPEGALRVKPGRHTVAFVAFMGDRPYASGRLDTDGAARVTIGLRQGEDPVLYDHEAWRPD